MSINKHLIKIALAVALSLLICGPVAGTIHRDGFIQEGQGDRNQFRRARR